MNEDQLGALAKLIAATSQDTTRSIGGFRTPQNLSFIREF
jgi:hypothetical protein